MGLFNFCSLDHPISGIVAVLIQLLALSVLARALLSWVVRDPFNPIVRALDAITEPILQPLRQVMPRLGMFDLSPLIAIIVLSILAGLVCGSGI